MKRTHLTQLLIAFSLCSIFKAKAQPNPVTNYGFEASSSVTGWNTSNHAGTSSITTSGVRSGGRAYSNRTNTKSTTGYIENNASIAVPAGKYLVIAGYYRVSASASTSRVQIGITGNMGAPVTPSSTNTTYRISEVVQNTTASTQNWSVCLNMYITNSTNRTFTWDDIIAYVSDYPTEDTGNPGGATQVQAAYTSSSATLSWVNGVDGAGGTGIQRSVILRRMSECASAQVLPDETVYSATGGYGESSEGNWTVLDTVAASVNTYTDNTIAAGSYYTYAVVHEDKAYNHAAPGLTYVPVSGAGTPISPANNATNVSYNPSVTLSWQAACGASAYDVYISTTQSEVNNMIASARVSVEQAATTCTPAIVMNANASYYWKVVPKNAYGNEAVNTPTWKFTTYTPALSYAATRKNNASYAPINTSGNNFSWSGTFNADDMMSDALDLTGIGFTGFRFQDREITSLKVNTNGFITFNLSSSASYTNSFSSQTLMVAPFWEDMVCQGYMNSQSQQAQEELLKSSLKYLVTGPSGRQVLTIEWNEMEIYNNPGPSINFQLKLYEEDDRIEFVYGRMFGFNGTVNYTYSYSSGISGFTVNGSPSAGQLICQQVPNVLNFSNTNNTALSELPDCYSIITLTPDQTPGSLSEAARAISNNECADAVVLPIQYGVQNDFCKVYSTKGATASSAIPACTGTTAGNADDDVWFKFTTTTAGNYGITVNGSGGFNPVVQLFSGNCNALTALSCVNTTGNGFIENLLAENLEEATYFVRVYDANSSSGGSGNFVISVYNTVTPPVNDDCAGAMELTIGETVFSGNTANATASSGIAACSASSPGTPDDDVWFKFTATGSITKIAANGGSTFNVVLQYFSGSCGNLSSIGCVSSTGASGIESVDMNTTIGNTYYIRVYHSANGATPTTGFTITATNSVPACPVLSSPSNGITSISRTSSRTLSWNAVTSPSAGTKTYSVQVSTNPEFTSLVNLSGASGITSTSFVIPANTLSAGTLYYWRVLCTNNNGTSSGCGYYTMATTGTSPSCASGFSPADGSTNQDPSVTLSWNAGSGSPTSYDVYLGTNRPQVNNLGASVRVSSAQTGTSYTASGLISGTTYYWTVVPKNGSGSGSGCSVNAFTVIPEMPANNDCNGAITLNTTSSNAVSGTVLNATQSMGASVGSSEDDVWYQFTAASAAHNISVEPSVAFNAVVELFSGTCGSLTSLVCRNENGIGGSENLSATGLTIGQVYYLRIYDFGSEAPATPGFSVRINDVDLGISAFTSPSSNQCGTTTVTISLKNYSVSPVNFAENPVTITSNVISPANVTTTFPAVNINTGTLQAGATQQVTLTTAYNVINSGTYRYSATSSTGSDNNITNNTLTSDLQTITLPSPYILSGTGSYCAGGTGVAFTLSGSETGITYQLYKANTALSAAYAGTGAALSFPNVKENGAYRVVAISTSTNCASYMSASAVVTVNPLWLGLTTDWNNPANWCGNTVPASNADIVISGSAVNMPVLPGNVLVNNLELDSNKRIDLNGRTLTINGKITGRGVIRGSASSSVVINGSGDMGTLKMDQTTGGTTNRLQNLTINVGSSKSSDSVIIGNRMEVTGTVSLSNGTLNAGGNLVLVSTAAGTARIGAIPATADITGEVISQRYIPAIARRSRMVSPNTSNFIYTDLKDDIFVTGAGAASNGFDASSHTQSATVYTYNESPVTGRGWKAIQTINDTLAAGQGTLVFVRGDRSLPAPQWYTAPYVSQNEVTIDFTGHVNKGDISPVISYTNTGDAASDGWNLVGNPYPSQINWLQVTKSNLNSFVYILDPSSNGYVANDGSTPIASGQAFFVQANAPSPSLTFTESCKTSGTGNSLFKTNQRPKLAVKMIKDSLNSDIAWLKFSTGASMAYDPMEDALKFTNATINMGFNVPANTDVQINTVPELTTNASDTFSIFTNAANGNYTLQFSQFGGIPANKSVLLRDLFTNSISNLRVDSVYAFTITSAVASKGKRFELIITDLGSLPVDLIGINAQAENKSDVKLTWVTASEKNNRGFVVQRAAEAGKWEDVAFVKGAGNSNTVLHYQYTDRDALANISELYYRIRQTDFSGAFTYSNVVKVNNPVTGKPFSETLTVYPNPARGTVTIESENADLLGMITITDVTGKVVKTTDVSSGNVQLDISDLNTGIYFIKSTASKAFKLIVN